MLRLSDNQPRWPFGRLVPFGYDVIVADPPWLFEVYSEAGMAKSPQAHYECMPLHEIKALPVGHLARGDALLLLWTCGWAMANTQAHDVARAWGATPITEIIWRKTTRNGKVRVGPGYRARTMHEPVLLCTWGKPVHKAFPSIFDGVARAHSMKPDEFYDLTVRMTPRALARADLFSAGIDRPGFDGWGEDHRKEREVDVSGK